MIYIDNILYIEFSEALESGISRRTILSWDNRKDPSDKRRVLIHYEYLKQRYKSLIIKTYGNPYEYCGLQLFKQYLNTDLNVLKLVNEWKDQLKNHKLPNGTGIPTQFYLTNGKRGIYVHACMLLH